MRKELEEEYKSELADNERQMEEMKKTFDEKLKAAQAKGGSVSTSSPHLCIKQSDQGRRGKYF